MNVDLSNIGKRMHKTRIKQNIEVVEMARKLKISPNSIINLENGKGRIELKNFFKICEFLNISIYDVLNEKNDNIINYMDKELYELIIKCNMQKQKFICNMVKILIKNQVV